MGSTLGNDDIIPPTDPHMHLAGGQSSWTNSGLVTGLALADGSYYISVQVHIYMCNQYVCMCVCVCLCVCVFVCVCVYVCMCVCVVLVCVCECEWMLYMLTRDSI